MCRGGEDWEENLFWLLIALVFACIKVVFLIEEISMNTSAGHVLADHVEISAICGHADMRIIHIIHIWVIFPRTGKMGKMCPFF